MPRASRYLLKGYTYHLTHRCHDRRFLLKLRQDRNAYREWLRQGIQRYGVPVYGYCITSSHVHVIVHAEDEAAVGDMMRLAAGATGQAYNRRKGQTGSFWEHPYQCTVIQDGEHLFNCLRYVDLNMVRAGAVQHPERWPWCGYAELMGNRQRYRLLDLDRLLASLGVSSLDGFRKNYAAAVKERLGRGSLGREPHWTESLAVGSESFVNGIQGRHENRRSWVKQSVPGESVWTIQESTARYNAVSPIKTAL